VNDKNEVVGLITQRNVTTLLGSLKLTLDSAITKALQKEFKKLKLSDDLKYLSKAFSRHQYVLIDDSESHYVAENKHLLDHMLKNSK
jgi:hypothetical protein